MAEAQVRVLAIHAHPDDIEFQCAGTLALLGKAGCHLTVATMTPGDCGSVEHDAEAIAAIRRREAKDAADLVGAHYHCLEFRDLSIFNDDLSRRRVVEFLRKVRPDLILTAPPADYLADHEATHLLVRDACFVAPIPNYATRQWEPAPALDHIPHLYLVDPIEGRDREGTPVPPHFWVDITEFWDVKRQMLACHASQRNWLMRQHGIDEYMSIQEQWSSHRGKEIGVAYAEGFRQYTAHPYPQNNLLLELVEQDGRGVSV
ncbi:PIG-L deacetylase family protein [Tautonia rosea]|uniref:PIG-L deacetylase family protein n=1 Tax=Tautonia rosea TaxID=2728037 RepID=UPI00147386A2|nr:PIG-L family deacetylase [Tautonia rosea]